MIRSLAELARVADGVLHGADAPFAAVTTDSRTLEPGSLFVALRGERFDGHQFLPDVQARGAAGALVEHPAATSLPQVVVRDALAGLTAFASAWRAAFDGRVVGVTGSNGKTTVKEMLGAILACEGPTLVTRGNLNNHIGVPLTLCRLEGTHRYAVIEMGANHRQEIAHLEGFGGLDGVAQGKGEMFEALGAAGTAVINADDRYASFWHGLARGAGRVLTFGVRERADFSARDVSSIAAGGDFATEFDMVTPVGERRVRLALAGEHNVMNALAAAAAAHGAGAGLDGIVEGLGRMRAVAGRLEVKQLPGGVRLIDDSYNANPASVRAGLRALSALEGEHWLVLGEMRELGEASPQLHAEIGEFARRCGVTRLLAVGDEARHAVETFGAGATWFKGVEDMTALLATELRPGVTVLVKGSRSNRLERVAEALGAGGGRLH